MNKMIAVVEGSTEQIFIRQVLAPWLRERCGMELVASTAGTPGSKGGNSYDRAKRDILKHLKNPYFAHVTTFFDFYGMGQKWPGRQGARIDVMIAECPHFRKWVETLQEIGSKGGQ